MDGEIVARELVFPEGPVWHAGTLYFVEIGAGRIGRLTADGRVDRIAETGGGPNGATLGADGALYVTQNGGMQREGRVTAGIQRVRLDGTDIAPPRSAGAMPLEVELLTSEVAGTKLDGPNDLAFGPDGRLYFTDPRGSSDPRVNHNPGRLFVWDVERRSGELLLELGPVFPNGIAFAADGTMLWTESFSRRVMALRNGRPELVIELPERHFPDGFCIGADGLLYVASTYAHCVSVIDGGQIVDRLMCGDGMVTNCCFGGTDLYVTDSRHGTLWRFPLGKPGLRLHEGRSNAA